MQNEPIDKTAGSFDEDSAIKVILGGTAAATGSQFFEALVK